MINKIRNIYGVTESGAKDLLQASIAAFFKNYAYMLPAFLTMFFAQGVIAGDQKSPGFYWIWIAVLGVIMGVIINIE